MAPKKPGPCLVYSIGYNQPNDTVIIRAATIGTAIFLTKYGPSVFLYLKYWEIPVSNPITTATSTITLL